MGPQQIIATWVKAARVKLTPIRPKPKPNMSLITRLTIPVGTEEKIPAHQFMALCAEYQRGVAGVDKAFIATTFNIVDAGELTELDDILEELVSKRSSREVVHDALLVGESGIYDATKVENRIAAPTGTTDLESITSRQVYRIQNFAQRGNFAFDGCNINAQTPRSMTLDLVGGSCLIAGRNVFQIASGTVAVPTPDTQLPRVDLIYIDNAGSVLVRQGTPELDPKAPQVSNQEVALAFVFVGANETEIGPGEIQDVRVVRDHGAMTIGRKSNPTTVSNDGSFNQLWKQDIPAGLLTGRKVRMVVGGTMTLGSPGGSSVDFRTRYGSTQLYRDGSATLSGTFPWRAEIELSGQDDAVQVMNGLIFLGDGSPNVGQGGIDGIQFQSAGVIRGTATEDSTTMLDLDIAVRMSVADPSNSVTLDWGQAELL